MTQSSKEKVVRFPVRAGKTASSTEKIWGKAVYTYGYTALPSILIRAQHRLGITCTQMTIITHLLDYWFEPQRKPFPSKNELAMRIGVSTKTIQINVGQLENAGLIKREMRKTGHGDYGSNIYHLDGLIKKVQALEPQFSDERKARKEAKAKLQTPIGLRKSAIK